MPVPMKLKIRKAAGSALAPGFGQREGERHPGIDDEIADDVEVAAEIGQPRAAGQRAIEAIEQAVEQQKAEPEAVGRSAIAAMAPRPIAKPARGRQIGRPAMLASGR